MSARASSPAACTSDAAIGIIASFWTWIAAVMGAYRKHKAGPAAIGCMTLTGAAPR
jgi:hypothetical protein